MDKGTLRQQFKKARQLFLKSELSSKNLAENLRQVIGPAESIWGTYLPQTFEADPLSTDASVDWAVQWAYPRITGEVLEFLIPKSSDWQMNEYKIREPGPKSKKVALKDLQGVLVPGVAFDRKGQRLGSGKGFFDKTLENYQGIKIGVAYSVQISEQELPAEAHDVRMDIVVTEKEIIHITERKAS